MPQIYAPLSNDSASIRIVRLAPSGESGDYSVVAELVETTWDESSYEALSYCWGKHYWKKTILLNGEPFKVTADLHDAMEQFALEDDTRSLWIDAICINQQDADEKSTQVQRMRDIYHKAEQVLVWIGRANDDTGLVFEQTENLLACEDEDARKAIWKESGEWAKSLNEMIERPYWYRAWTVQEVVLAKSALLCCGSYTTPFFDFARLLIQDMTRDWVKVTYGLTSYLEQVFEMRDPAYQDPPLGLFGLAYKLRFRRCTMSHDRLYAFLGLLKSTTVEDIPIDYTMSESKLWMAVAKATMARYKTLLPLVLAERATSYKAQWCYDWSSKSEEPNTTLEGAHCFWAGGLDNNHFYPLQVPRHSAAGGLEARVRVDLEAPSVIAARGYTVSKVVKIGTCVPGLFSSLGRPNYVQLFEEWESLVGGPWEDQEMANRFSHTVIGGAWDVEPINWRVWNTENYSQNILSWNWWVREFSDEESAGYTLSQHYKSGPTEAHARYSVIRDHACEQRRMFVLDNGDFGLGPEGTKVGDSVAVLLGSEVPLVLHERDHGGIRWLIDAENKWELYKSTWKVMGQAYVHSIMNYEGDLEQDIEDGEVVLEEFFLD